MMKTKPIPTTSSVRKMIAANARINRARSEPSGRRASSQVDWVVRSVVTAGIRLVGCSSNEAASELPGTPWTSGDAGGAGSGEDSGLGLIAATGGPRGKLIGGNELVADAPD